MKSQERRSVGFCDRAVKSKRNCCPLIFLYSAVVMGFEKAHSVGFVKWALLQVNSRRIDVRRGEQIKDGNNAIVEQLNCTYDKVNTIIEQNKKLVLQLSKESQSIAQQINEIGNYIARVEDKIIKGQALTRLECQAITTQLNSLHNELTKSVAQTKDELLKVENTNYQELRKSVMQLDKKTGTSISYSKAEIVLLALVIILMITLFS